MNSDTQTKKNTWNDEHRVTASCRVSKEVYADLQRKCEADGIAVNAFLKAAITAYLNGDVSPSVVVTQSAQ